MALLWEIDSIQLWVFNSERAERTLHNALPSAVHSFRAKTLPSSFSFQISKTAFLHFIPFFICPCCFAMFSLFPIFTVGRNRFQKAKVEGKIAAGNILCPLKCILSSWLWEKTFISIPKYPINLRASAIFINQSFSYLFVLVNFYHVFVYKVIIIHEDRLF